MRVSYLDKILLLLLLLDFRLQKHFGNDVKPVIESTKA
jgi:hypothetical protein